MTTSDINLCNINNSIELFRKLNICVWHFSDPQLEASNIYAYRYISLRTIINFLFFFLYNLSFFLYSASFSV